MDPIKLDWLDSFIGSMVGLVGGIIASVLGMASWFGRKVDEVNSKIEKGDKRLAALEQSAFECRMHQQRQEDQHSANLRQFDLVKDELGKIDGKQDKQTELLTALLIRLGSVKHE